MLPVCVPAGFSKASVTITTYVHMDVLFSTVNVFILYVYFLVHHKAKANMKYISLLILVIQNSSLVLLLRYSRIVSGQPYIASTAVFLTEVLKIVCSVALLYYEMEYNYRKTAESIYDIFVRFTETLWVAVPAFLYTIQNNLLYVALTKLDAATYQVCIVYTMLLYNTYCLCVCVSRSHIS